MVLVSAKACECGAFCLLSADGCCTLRECEARGMTKRSACECGEFCFLSAGGCCTLEECEEWDKPEY
ncbi:hypothetical protein HOLleu_15249 [Holothuria leucospilota]|uniref:Uncharacterized protein n=1 Tax=Holothuria leucospilota TaxID=206669 RepID=A0A9Q1C9Y5_HOLLE|nr:hypothetical protein HOLleu_15249 [Holothuria leucospilota]